MKNSLLCLIDEAGSLDVAIQEPFRVGILLSARPERLFSDLRALKTELPPLGKWGEYHAREDNPLIRTRLRALLCLNDEPRLQIVEWAKTDFSADFIVNGKLAVLKDTNPLIASFALQASVIAAAASAHGICTVDIVAEASKVDIRSEHRSKKQAFNQVLYIAMQKQMQIKKPPMGTATMIRVSTKRKSQYPPLSFVDHWLWAYCRYYDHGDAEAFPDALRQRTTVKRMTESDFRGDQNSIK